MSFLLAKILILLLLAALLGALLARWWLRRHYEDVTTEYNRVTQEAQGWRNGLEDRIEQRLAHRLGVDLGPVLSSVQSVHDAVREIQIPPANDVDLQPLHTRLNTLAASISGIHIPAAKDVDLSPMQTRIDAVHAAVQAIHIPAAMEVDLDPLLERLRAIELALEQTQAGLRQLALATAERPASAPVPAPAPAPAPGQRFDAAPTATVRAGSRNLLSSAAYGKPDDLKMIKGVAEVLEEMLHGIGVYYFWQMADWSSADIAHADAKLTAFKGRILRDDWKSQSIRFAQAPGAARKPEGF